MCVFAVKESAFILLQTVPNHLRMHDLKHKLLKEVSFNLFLKRTFSCYLLCCDVAGERNRCDSRVPRVAVGRQPHHCVRTHHVSELAGLHARSRRRQDVLPQRRHPFDHHPTRISRGMYALLQSYDVIFLFSLFTSPALFLVLALLQALACC